MSRKGRNTKQKELLLKALLKCPAFFTADDLFLLVDKENIGIATVYRFLKDLRKKGELHSFKCDKKLLYAREHKSHCHFHCEKCGTVSHFMIEHLDSIKSRIPGNICHFQIDVYGECNFCKKKLTLTF